MKHHIKCENVWTNNAVISKTCYQMFQLSAIVPNWCPQPKSSLINRLMDAWPTVIRMSPQLINISHRILTDPLL